MKNPRPSTNATMSDNDKATIAARRRAGRELGTIAYALMRLRGRVDDLAHNAGGRGLLRELCGLLDTAETEARKQAESCYRAARFIAGDDNDSKE